ncbi:MAG: ribbon-helix-helix protein, CopG family [Chlamydiae bacterium]|nr:ribbon-helix-helix protein, CopG family [Chlamydiota bacterium]MBI3277929.1 ribbon-helix-helix protein, CopG family [Chlamydiota bacterium]
MKTKTVNISFQNHLLSLIDKMARNESRTRSELIREASRAYIDRKNKWKTIFAFGKKQVGSLKLKESDIEMAIKQFREKRKSSH